MCGICGVVSSVSRRPVDQSTLRRMCQVLYHRGPDDEGLYLDDSASLGIRRLSIIDLSTGHQPISNETENIWLVFNGEIYNYQELRVQLIKRGHVFKSRSDSEVIVHAYEEYGDACVDYLNGMFAFAIWDSSQYRLMLARDRLGIKPLYYWHNQDEIVFGSELKALLMHPDVPREIDLQALDQFLTLEYVPGPKSILQGVHKLPPGHRLLFQEGRIAIERYWNISVRKTSGNSKVFADELRSLIQESVRMRLVSDVPLGAFLSGGIDSSTIVAFMSEASSSPVRSFSIGFEDDTYNELPYARIVASRFGTEHHEEVLRPDITRLAEKLVDHLDEPLSDFSIFPTYLVSKLASRHVKVVLSGDGGDEIFAGYDTYVAQQLDTIYSRLPARLRQQMLPNLMSRVPPQSAKKGLINKAKRFVEGASLTPLLQHTRWMIFLTDEERDRLYSPLLRAELNGVSSWSVLEDHFVELGWADNLAQQQYVDIKTYLVDNILTKVDRMSMAASVEARVPFLDHRIVDLVVNLPPRMKLNRFQTKVILREVMTPYLPEIILNKPKQGFSIPLKHWLRGPLQPLMTDLLAKDTIRSRGYFDPLTVSTWIQEHLNSQANHSHRLWALMVLELWLQRNLVAYQS